MPIAISVLIPRQEIESIVRVLAHRLSSHLEKGKGKEIVLLGVLKGAYMFMAGLSKEMRLPHQVDFIQLSSYKDGMESSGKIEVVKHPTLDLKDKDVVIVEDIIDTGLTVNFLVGYLQDKDPRSIIVCSFLDKPARRKVEIPIEKYIGKEIEDKFVIGYGLDLNERYRGMSYVGEIAENSWNKRK